MVSLMLICALFILMLIMPENFTESTYSAVLICLTSVIPSLFCFIVITKLIVSSGCAYLVGKAIGGIFFHITGLPGFCAGVYLLSFLSGFPSGVIAAADLYKNSVITKSDCEHLAAISNNTGPSLPVLLIGNAFWKNTRAGVYVFVIQILSSLACAFILRKQPSVKGEPHYPRMHSNLMKAVTDSVEGTVKSTAMLCAYVILFSAVSDLLTLTGIDQLNFIKPFIEIVSGARVLSKGASPGAFIAICSAISFGGLCVHMQAASVMSPLSLSMKKHMKAKLLQAIIAGIISCVFIISGIFA